MNLSLTEINHIKNRIEKKGFKHLDVQAEILDHIASAIEDKISENPALSVQEAYDLTYSELGIFAFSNFEESITKKIRSELFSSYVNSFKTFFSSIKVFFPILFFGSVYLLQKLYPEEFLNISFGIIIASPLLLGLLWVRSYLKNKFFKRYLSFKLSVGTHFSLFFIMFYLLHYGHYILNPILIVFYTSIYLTFQLILFYGAQAVMHKTRIFDKLVYNLSS